MYKHHLQRNRYLQSEIAKYWPFIYDEDKRLQDIDIVLHIFEQVIKEENYPKSANSLLKK
jgi:hypothetical protein